VLGRFRPHDNLRLPCTTSPTRTATRARSPPVAFLCRGCPTAAWAMRASREGSPASATQTPCAGSRQDYRSSSFKAGCVTLTSPPPPDRTDISPGDRARTAPSRHHARHRVPVALRREDLVPGGGSKRRRPPRHRPRRRGPRPFHRGRRPRPGTRNATPPSVVGAVASVGRRTWGAPGTDRAVIPASSGSVEAPTVVEPPIVDDRGRGSERRRHACRSILHDPSTRPLTCTSMSCSPGSSRRIEACANRCRRRRSQATLGSTTRSARR
jgi:hypothetical protein